MHVSSVCFICFKTYVLNVLSRCFKSRSGRAHVAMESVASGLPQSSAIAARAPPWITVWVPKAGRRLCGTHTQARAGDGDRSHVHAAA
jgi:hypothetical protein